MKNLWWIAISNVAMWLSVSAAVIYALHLTERISALWFFLIPLFGSIIALSYSVKFKQEGGARDE